MNDFDVDQPTVMLLFGVYNMPNIIIPLFGGLIIDKIGMRTGLMVFSIVVLLG